MNEVARCIFVLHFFDVVVYVYMCGVRALYILLYGIYINTYTYISEKWLAPGARGVVLPLRLPVYPVQLCRALFYGTHPVHPRCKAKPLNLSLTAAHNKANDFFFRAYFYFILNIFFNYFLRCSSLSPSSLAFVLFTSLYICILYVCIFFLLRSVEIFFRI